MNIGCRVPDCGRIAYQRDICFNCYRRFHRQIVQGKTTWTELEAKGLVAKAKERGWGKRSIHDGTG